MQKVKVHRYISGKRPDYAAESSSEDDSDSDGFVDAPTITRARPVRRRSPESSSDEASAPPVDDPRLRRLTQPRSQNEATSRHRHVDEPEVLEKASWANQEDDESDDAELSADELDRRRNMLRQKLLNNKEQEMEILDKEDDKKSEASGDEESEFEEYTDSEEETGPRLKPVFIRKKERVTIIDKEKEAQKQKQIEIESAKMAEERRRQTLKMIEDDIRRSAATKVGDEPSLGDVNTDDENDELDYDAWKLRELKRIKRDREEREALEKERIEIERLRNMTEEERRLEARNNPKQVTNKNPKGKYKFLQKYYHRGAFYLNEEQDVLKRDFSSATLEDHFDKTILPKVMQVKNFGRSGRTKYTHLVDQDTTEVESPWAADTTHNLKFYSTQAAGMKQVFEKQPRHKKRSTH